MSIVGRVFRGVGRVVGNIHGRVFRALGSLPLVGGAFKALGKFSAAGLGLLSKLSPLSMLGLGALDPFSSFTGGMSQGIHEGMAGRPAFNMGNSFNNMYGPPQYGGGYGGGGYGGYGGGMPGYGGYGGGMPGGYGMPPFGGGGYGGGGYPYGQQQCCCSCGHRHF